MSHTNAFQLSKVALFLAMPVGVVWAANTPAAQAHIQRTIAPKNPLTPAEKAERIAEFRQKRNSHEAERQVRMQRNKENNEAATNTTSK